MIDQQQWQEMSKDEKKDYLKNHNPTKWNKLNKEVDDALESGSFKEWIEDNNMIEFNSVGDYSLHPNPSVLEQYKDEQGNILYPLRDDDVEKYGRVKSLDIAKKNDYNNDRKESYKKGFNAVLALDLPVKFGKWLKKALYVDDEGVIRFKVNLISNELAANKGLTTEKAYQYWLNNIYKPE